MADLTSIIGGAVEAAGGGTASDDPGSASTPDVSADPPAETPTLEAEAPATDEQAVADPTPTEPAATDTPSPAADEVPDLSAAELAGATIPVHRHKAVLTKTRKEKDALQAELATYKSEDVQQRLKAIEVADKDPELFASVLLEDPTFRAILEKKMGPAAPAKADAPVAPKTDPVADLELPQPDVLLSDGQVGYSADAGQKLAQYYAQKATREAEERMQKKLDERFGEVDPLLQTHKAQVEYTKHLEKSKALLAEKDRIWPKFKENREEIKAFLSKPENAKTSLEQAYITIVFPKLQADRDTMRKEILTEMKTKPAAVSPGPKSQSATPPNGGKRSLETVIGDAIARVSA